MPLALERYHPTPILKGTSRCSGMLKRQVCGTESTATFDRADFGMPAGKDYGFKMATVLHIQAEGILQ